MIARIIELSVRNRFLVMLLTAIVVGTGIWSVFHLKLDAIPDLSDVQVIVVTEYPGQNPQVVDDQVTYPLASSLLSVPGATVVRGFSMFELSFVYVLFEDGSDIYWARSRVLEYLNFARDRLPKGVEPKLGPNLALTRPASAGCISTCCFPAGIARIIPRACTAMMITIIGMRRSKTHLLIAMITSSECAGSINQGRVRSTASR